MVGCEVKVKKVISSEVMRRVLLLGVIWQGACITAGGQMAGGVYYCWGSFDRGHVLLLGVIWQGACITAGGHLTGACITAGSHLAGGVYYCWESFGRGHVLLLGVIWQKACITAGWLTEANTCDVWPLIEAIIRSGSRFLLSVSHNHSPDPVDQAPTPQLILHLPTMCLPTDVYSTGHF